MQKVKYIIVALILIIVIIVLLIVILNQKNSMKEDNIPQDTFVELAKNSVKENNDNVFFTINDIIKNNVEKEKKGTLYYAQEMYKIQDYEYANYYTYGFILNESDNELQDYYLRINIDYTNNTFETVELSMEEYQKAKNGEIKNIEQKSIQKSNDNVYEIEFFSSGEIASRYAKDYIMKAKYKPDSAFSLLETQYRNSKFKDIVQFKEYLQENNSKFNKLVMQRYQCEVKENSIEYTVYDQNDNYYKIIVYKPLDYKVILDNDG